MEQFLELRIKLEWIFPQAASYLEQSWNEHAWTRGDPAHFSEEAGHALLRL